MVYLPNERDFTMFNGKIDSYTPPEASSVNQLRNSNTRFVDQYKYISFEIAQDSLDERSIDLSKCNYVTIASGFLSSSNNAFRPHMHTKTPVFTDSCHILANELEITTTMTTTTTLTASSSTTTQTVESTTTLTSTLTSETNPLVETTTSATSMITPLYKFRFQMRLNYTFDDELNNVESESHNSLTNSILEFCQNALLEANLTFFSFYNVGSYTSGSVLVDWDLYFDSIEPVEFQTQLNIAFNSYAKAYSNLDIFTDSIQITHESSFPVEVTQPSSTTTESPLNDIRFLFQIKILSNFSQDLFDSSSDEFKNLLSAIETIVLNALTNSNTSDGFKDLRILNITSNFEIDLLLTFDQVLEAKFQTLQTRIFSAIWNYVKDENLTIPIDILSIHLSQLIDQSDHSTTTSTTSTTTSSYEVVESTTDVSAISYTTPQEELINAKKEVIQPVALNDLNLKMKLTSDYNSKFNDSTSLEYKGLSDQIKLELSKAFNKSNISYLTDFKINSFKPGSVLVDSTLSFSKQIDTATVLNSLKSHFTASNLLNVDLSSISVGQGNSGSDSSSSSSNNDGIIAAIVVPISIFVILLGAGSFVLFKRYKKKKMKKAVKVNEDATFRPPLNPYDQISKNKLDETKQEEEQQRVNEPTIVREEREEDDKRSTRSYSKSDKTSLKDYSIDIDIMKSESFTQRLEEIEMNKMAKLKMSESNETLNESKMNELEELDETNEEDTNENKIERDHGDLEQLTEKDEEDASSEKPLDFSKADEALRQAAKEAKEDEKPQIVNRFDMLPEADKASVSMQDSLPNQYFESKLPESETIAITNANQLVDDDISDTGTEDNYTNKDDQESEESEEEESENDGGKTIHI